MDQTAANNRTRYVEWRVEDSIRLLLRVDVDCDKRTLTGTLLGFRNISSRRLFDE